MANFDPGVPQVNPPEWLHNFRPAKEPDALQSDKSTGIALHTAAEGLTSAVGIGEGIAQDIIKDKTRAGVDALRGATTLAYENIRNAQAGGTTPSVDAMRTAGFTGSLATASSDVPASLQAGLDRAGDLATARSQGAIKANDTLYTGALDSLAKQLRAEYPGHKDFIDEQISRISGKNPANAYMDNLLQDIRAGTAKQDTYEKQVQTKAMENYGAPDVKIAMDAVHAGIPGAFPKLADAVFRAETDKWQHQKNVNQHTDTNNDLSDDANLAKYQAQQLTASLVFRNFNSVIATPGLTDIATQQRLLDEHRAGLPSSITPNQWENMAQNAERARDITANQIKDMFNGGGYSKRIRDPAAETAIQTNELQYFTRQIQAIREKDVGTLLELARRNKGAQDHMGYQMLTNPNFGDFLLKDKVLNDIDPQWHQWVMAQGLQKKYLGPMQDFVGDSQFRASFSDDVRKDGVAKGMTADIIAAKQAAKTNPIPSRTYDDLVDNVNLITKAAEMGKLDIAKEVAKYSFDPARNGNLLKQFGKDFTDANNVFHKGQFAYYDVMTKPKIVDSVVGLKDPQTTEMMKNWQEVSFKTLFGEEVTKLNSIQGDRSLPMSLRWEGNQFVADYPKATTNIEANYIDNARESLKNLNRGLQNLAYMHSKTGEDDSTTPAYMFNMLMDLGYSPNDRLHGDNMPQRAIQAIAASVKPKPTAGEALKAAE